MEKLGWGLQFLGLIIVPMALVVGLMEQHNAMTRELMILMLGGGLFYLGYLLIPGDKE